MNEHVTNRRERERERERDRSTIQFYVEFLQINLLLECIRLVEIIIAMIAN